jgi:hypothetical protein
MSDVLKGRGTLISQWPPNLKIEVSYELRFSPYIRAKRSGLPLVGGVNAEVTCLQAVDGSRIPEGNWELKTEDGETILLSNIGGEWDVMAGVR